MSETARDPPVRLEPLDVVHDAGEIVFRGEGAEEWYRSSAYTFLANVR